MGLEHDHSDLGSIDHYCAWGSRLHRNLKCATYIYAESSLAVTLGLTYRNVEFVGEHAWVEVEVNGN